METSEDAIIRLNQELQLLEKDIAWAKYALETPKHLMTDSVREYRTSRLEMMQKELKDVSRQIEKHKFQLLETKVLAERADTKRKMLAILNSSK